jgi:capsule polysaccharide export protein KpsE/RkpR
MIQKIYKFLLNILFKLSFLTILVYSIYYIFFIETEKYESHSIIVIKDLAQKQSSSPLASLLSAGSSSSSDAKLLKVYINSYDMYKKLDKEFNLTNYYQSNKIDLVHRLYRDIPITFLQLNQHNLLLKYRDDLLINYNEESSSTTISFSHEDAKIAQKIVQRITQYSGDVLNIIEKKNTEIILRFLEKETEKKHQRFLIALQKLLAYQNANNTIDPSVEIELKSSQLASLEAELLQKKIEYKSKSEYLNSNIAEMKISKSNIKYIQKNIQNIREEMSGNSKKNKKLNLNLSDFSLLKNKLEFEKELYIQTLTKLEETKIVIRQNSKNLIVVTQAKISDSYSYPNKVRDSFSIFILFFFFYNIISLVYKIIRDHKD